MASFKFEVIETLKGKPSNSFVLRGYTGQESQNSSGDFSGHQAPAFWAMQASNSVSPGDCDFYGIFREQETYLIFMLPYTHARAFENVRSKDDIWLNVVRLLTARESK